MELDQSKNIVMLIAKQGNKGLGVLALCKATKLGYNELHSFVTSHKDIFLKVLGKPSYRLNPYYPYQGDTKLILQALKQERRLEQVCLYIVMISVFVSVVVNISGGLAK